MKSHKRKSVFDLPKKRCEFFGCKKFFKPDFSFQKYHTDKCRYHDHYYKRAAILRDAKARLAEAANG